MAERVAPKRPVTKIASVEGLFDAKKSIKSSHTGELVIALCGPIGSPIHKVGEMVKARLKDDFAYDECEIIRLSNFIEKYSKQRVPSEKGYARKKALIDAGDALRKDYGASILAEFAVNQIAIERQKAKATAGEELFKPRRVCHIIDSIKNQEELDVLQLVYRDMLYFVGVYSPLPSRVKEMEKGGLTNSDIFTLIDRDSGEELDHGQTVRDTFPLADFFLRIDADTDTQIKAKVERFLQLILGTKVLTPTFSETAMYVAASAAGNSACLSRQVGAAICDKDGEILAVGWNDVPKPDGGLYVADQRSDPNSEKDKRCWNIDGGVCFNDREKEIISEFVVGELIAQGVVSEANRKSAAAIVANSKVKTLIEFSRSIHAEMHAILTAGHLAGSRIRGSALYCTTYPCHACARHIIAAGISEVYYIEPYRKSLATKLHSDAITEDESDNKKVRILPYDGVPPNRYLKLFRVPANSRKLGGKMITVDPKKAAPRFDKTLEALPQLEALVVKGLEAKNISAADIAAPMPAGANDA
jgi:deoxycytidylate deaminase